MSSSNDGLEFASSKPVGDGFESDFEPALATDGTQFFLAWRDRNGYLALASSTNGRDFGEPLVLNTTTRTAPALAYGDGMLLLAWVDDGRRLHLWPAADAASLQFLVEQRIDLDERSPGAPNLQYARKTWTLTWAGSDHKVNIQTYRGSIEAIPTKHTLAHRGAPITEYRPAIAVLDVWLLAWTRPDGRVGLLVSKSRQPGYINELALDVSSGAGVNLTPFQGDVLLTWAGDDEQPGGHVLRLP